MKPVCVKCRRFFKPAKTGVSVMEQMPCGNDAPPGNTEPENWKPYKLWQADLYRCDGCGHEVITGFAQLPSAEHYQPEFKDKVARARQPIYEVNDC